MPLPFPHRQRLRLNLTPLFRGYATLGLLVGFLYAAAQCQAAGNIVRVNLGAFSGDDQLSRAVAETLLTDLAKSGRIAVLNGRGTDHEDGAYILTGSCLVYEGNVVINARLIESSTGRTLPGAAENVDGPKAQVFSLVHSLAGKLTVRLTGDSGTPPPAVAKKPSIGMGLPSLKPSLGLPLPHTNANVNLGGGRAGIPPVRTKPPVVVTQAPPSVPIPEVGVRVDNGEVADDREPEMAEGQPEQRDRVVRSETRDEREQMDRGETSDPIQRSPRSGHDSHVVSPRIHQEETGRDRDSRYTSLIIDARGLDLDRSMSPVIRRKDGSVVWNGGEANPDFVISDGIVAYAGTMREARDQARAGSRPLIIEAVARHETPFPSDPYVDDEDADYILKASAHDGFLKKFRVIFVIGR